MVDFIQKTPPAQTQSDPLTDPHWLWSHRLLAKNSISGLTSSAPEHANVPSAEHSSTGSGCPDIGKSAPRLIASVQIIKGRSGQKVLPFWFGPSLFGVALGC